jgi:hypothetical protein
MSKYVVLRPLGMNPWSKIKRYRNCFDGLGPYLTRSGRQYTGLTEEDAIRLGGKLGLDLSPNSDFWNTFRIRMGSKDWYLDLEDPMDELRYLFAKAHKRVSSSIFDRKPGANYILINKEEEAKLSNVFSKIKRKAYSEFDRLSPEDMRRCLRLFGHNATSMGNEQVENLLSDIIEGNPQKFLDKWVNNERRDVEYIVETAVARNVIRKNKNVYHYGADIIGHSMDDTVSYLSSPSNQDIKISILKEIGVKEEFFGTDEPTKVKKTKE